MKRQIVSNILNAFLIICFIFMSLTVILQLLLSQPFLHMILCICVQLSTAIILICNIYLKDKKNIIIWTVTSSMWVANLTMSIIAFINT